jgi:large subunit ribosomal protein L21
MYAIIRTGGKQYRVEPGEKLRVEKLDHKLGSSFEITDVLFVGGENALIGTPTVSGAKVGVVVTQHAKSPKILVFKKKRRKGYRRLKGHRQPFTELFVSYITSPSGTKKAEEKPQIIDREKTAEKKAAIRAKLSAEGKKAAPKAAKTAAPKAKAKAKKGPAKKGAKKKAAGKKAKRK